MAAGRDGVDHGQGRALPDHPVRAEAAEPGRAVAFPAAGQGVLHQLGALVQAVAAVADVLLGLVA